MLHDVLTLACERMGMGMTVRSVDPWTGEPVFAAPARRRRGDRGRGRPGRGGRGALGGHAGGGARGGAAALRRAVEADAGALAELIVREVGKRRADAEGEVAWTAALRPLVRRPPAGARAGRQCRS